MMVVSCTWRCCSAESLPSFCDGDIRLCPYHGMLVLSRELIPGMLMLPSSWWRALRGLRDEPDECWTARWNWLQKTDEPCLFCDRWHTRR